MLKYKFKKEKEEKLLKGKTKIEVAKEIGITREFLTNVCNGKQTASKVCAYAITKYISSEAEIEDYFERVSK